MNSVRQRKTAQQSEMPPKVGSRLAQSRNDDTECASLLRSGTHHTISSGGLRRGSRHEETGQTSSQQQSLNRTYSQANNEAWLDILRKRLSSANIRQVFKKYDTDRNKGMDITELTNAMMDMHMPVTAEAIAKCLKNFDRDHDERLSFHEFKELVKRTGFRQKLYVHIKAFVSFLAVVLYWNGLYDALGVVPTDLLIDKYVVQQGLNPDAGPGYTKSRYIEVLVGSALTVVTTILLIVDKGFLYAVGSDDDDDDEDDEDESKKSDDDSQQGDKIQRDEGKQRMANPKRKRKWWKVTFKKNQFLFHMDRWIKFNWTGMLCVALWAGIDIIYSCLTKVMSDNMEQLVPRISVDVAYWLVGNIVLLYLGTMSDQFGGKDNVISNRDEEVDVEDFNDDQDDETQEGDAEMQHAT